MLRLAHLNWTFLIIAREVKGVAVVGEVARDSPVDLLELCGDEWAEEETGVDELDKEGEDVDDADQRAQRYLKE